MSTNNDDKKPVPQEKDNPNNGEHKLREDQSQNSRGDIKKNPNPRANENLTEETKEEAPASGVGSEVTDGEAG